MKFRLGDTIAIRLPKPFKPAKGIFDGIVGLDKNGAPYFEPDEFRYELLDTPGKVEVANSRFCFSELQRNSHLGAVEHA